MSHLRSNTPGGITTYMERTARPTPPAADAELSSRHIPQRFNVFQHIPCVINNLPKPDLLHTMQTHILGHPYMWIFQVMKLHTWLDKYIAITLFMPAYLKLTKRNTSYEEVSQWNRVVINRMSWYLLGVATQTLQDGSPTHRPIINPAMECTSAFYHSIFTLNIHLTRLQHWATWRTCCAFFTPSKMFSNSGELANIQRLKPIPCERKLWRRER